MSELPDQTRTTLSLEQMERLTPFGVIAEAPAGTVLVEAEDRQPDLIVVLEGEIEVSNLRPRPGRKSW